MTLTIKEEIANSITHGIGFLLSIAGLVVLIIFSAQTGDPWKVVSFTIYGTTLILLFLFSTLHHSIQHKKTKYIFEIMDHSAIFLLIAGTYTPFVLVSFRGGLGWTIFGVIWGVAVLGIVFKVFFVKKFVVLSTILYILMGWLMLIGIKPLYGSIGGGGFALLLAGGLFYTLGSIFYILQRVPYFHTIWHIFVLAGSSLMYFCVLFYV